MSISRRVIESFDFKGDTWELMIPRGRLQYDGNEVWLSVRRTTAQGWVTNYPMIPVPVFTEWWT